MRKNGLIECEKALDRLINNSALNSRFSSINTEDITPAMVSVEAGFDKGYLKRSRVSHENIIRKIDNLSNKKKKKNREHRNKSIDDRISTQKEIMQIIMTQNLKLMRKVQEYENAMVLLIRNSDFLSVNDVKSPPESH